MAIDRIEVAVECDDIDEDAIPVLALFMQVLGLHAETDVEAVVSSTDEGKPVLVAVLTKEELDDNA